MVHVLRALGWLIFGVSAIAFVALGGFTAAREGSVPAMAAGIAMPVGMFVTATCTMVAGWRSARKGSSRG